MKETLKDAWFLKTESGRQRWFFDKQKAAEITGSQDENSWLDELDQLFVFDKKANPNASDSIFRSKSKANKNQEKSDNAEEALSKGIEFFASLQEEDGNWAGDYGGPLFLMPGLIIVQYITNSLSSPEKQVLMKRYLLNHQNEDGGWGLHIEGESTMFGTTLNYVSLILLGHSIDDAVSKKAVNWIHENGGVTGIPPWGKLYLALLGLYNWKGLDALLPEMWLLPKGLPIYPGNYWNHARMVYLPMSYLSGIRFQLQENELIKDLKNQLYQDQFELTNWKKARRYCCPKDDYYPEPKLYVFASRFLNLYNRTHLRFLRKKALKNIVKRIQAEDIHTNHINLGPVNKALNMLVNFIVEGKSGNFEKHVNRVDDYLWLSEDGIKMNGYNGSQFWDTAFMAHALMDEKSISDPSRQILNKIEKFIDSSFIRHNEFDREKYDRSVSIGGWPFSTVDHGWPITDCTSEGMKAVLSLEKHGLLKNKTLLSDIKSSIDFVLENQNKNGGWASYEKTRGPKWLEKMNPSRIFGEIMIDYSYVECTSACLQSLKSFSTHNPNYRNKEIQTAIQNGLQFIVSQQMKNGLWYGGWAVCFTNATWFALEAMMQCGNYHYNANDIENPVTKACHSLIEKQNNDGSWGESYLSSVTKKYVSHEKGQVVNTAWVILSLLAADYPNKTVIDKGIQFLVSQQETNGDWPQQAISGVFNHNCMITYINYRNIFPIWALQRYKALS